MKYDKKAMIAYCDSIIKVRFVLNQKRVGGIQMRQKCNAIMLNLRSQIDSYKVKWSPKQVQDFIKRNYDDFLYLLPGGNSGRTRVERLNDMIQ